MHYLFRFVMPIALGVVTLAMLVPAGCESTGTNPTPTPTPTPPGGEKQRGLGLAAADPEVVASRPQAVNPYGAGARATLPESVDLTPHLPPIGDQGQMGSCVAFAAGYAGATYTANRQYEWGATSRAHQASPGYLYAHLLAADSADCGDGTYVDQAINMLIRDGCASLAAVDYSDEECLADPDLADGANFRIGSYNRVEPTDRNAVRGELAAGRIIVIGARLQTNFMDFESDEVYVGNGFPLMDGEMHAGHAMAVVGYDNARGAYRIMNSWGTQWGDNGFIWMKYETFEETVDEAYSLEPTGTRTPTVDPGTEPGDPDPVDPGASDPEGQLDEAYQFADVDENGQPVIYLIFFWHFDAPVLIRSITVTDPKGSVAQQTYDTWFLDGYVYFVRDDGFQWAAGTYTLEFDTQTQAGNDVIYAGEAQIDPLDEGSGDELCLNTCFFAYDGVCDDGGEGSEYDVCDYGTDCYDCGARFDGEGEGDGGDGEEIELCEDTCEFAGDGVCDDGGEGSEYDDCALGTDCSDCGPRVDEVVFAKSSGRRVIRTFRGIAQVGVPAAAKLPPAGVREGILGANRKPAVILPLSKP